MENPRKMKSVLLVDDEQEICELLGNMLRRTGTTCTIAHSVAQGRAALQHGDFDAVFLDIRLPDGLGYELIPAIRSTQPNARVITISAVDHEGHRATAEGADLFVPKPFTRSIIMSSIIALGFQA
jgi:two-component system OmpR family response regulator